MTRIFDALRKAAAGVGPTPLAPRMPVGVPAAGPSAEPPAPPAPPPAPHRSPAHRGNAGALGDGDAYPLAGGIPLPDDVVREMTTLRVAVESALPAQGARVVMFTAPQGREGASTIALQFLEVLARDPQCRPVLLDANVRRPALEVDPVAGVARLGAGLRTRVGDAAVLTPNAHVIAAPEEARRVGVFTSQSLRACLEQAAGRFDWIIVDGPPVLDSPDAAPLAGTADGVVLVLEAGRTKRPVLVRSADLLRNAGARVLGSVLNRRRLEIPEFIYRRI